MYSARACARIIKYNNLNGEINIIRDSRRIEIFILGMLHFTLHIFQASLPPIFLILKNEFSISFFQLGLVLLLSWTFFFLYSRMLLFLRHFFINAGKPAFYLFCDACTGAVSNIYARSDQKEQKKTPAYIVDV